MPMRRTPLRGRNPERARESYARNYGDRGGLVREMSCLAAHRALRVVEHVVGGRPVVHWTTHDSLRGLMLRLLSLPPHDAQDEDEAADAADQLLRTGRLRFEGDPSITLERDVCRGPMAAAHARARGMGGRGGDRRSLVPLCAHHHDASHRLTREEFVRRYQVDLLEAAVRIAVEIDQRGVT